MSAPTTPFGRTPTQLPSYRDDFYTPRRPRIISTIGLGVSTTITLCCILIILGHPLALVILAAALGAVVTTAVGIATRRHWLKTSSRPAAMRQAVAAVIGQPLPERLETQPGRTLTARRYTRGTLTTPGPARRIILNARFLAMLDPARLETITAALSRLEGIHYTVGTKKNKPGRYIFTPKPPEKTVKLTPKEQVEQRMTDAAKDVFDAGARVAFTWDEKIEDYLVSVDITGIKGINYALSGKQNQAGARLLSQLTDKNFTYAAFPGEDRFTLSRSRPLPAIVMPPASAAPRMADHRAYRQFEVPLGIGPNGAQSSWRPAQDSHLLIIGGTNGGKTICEHGVIQALTQAGWRVWLVDGKRVEFLGYRDWRNVEFLAQNTDAQIRLIHLAHETMNRRYDLIQAGSVRVDELDPIVLVIDEVTSLLAAVDQRYAETKVKGMRTKPPVLDWLSNLGRLARTAKIHLVFGMQRPDTTFIDGELRDNFGARISLGKLKSAAGSVMMWDNHAIGCQIPPVRGRAVSLIDGQPTMIQATYNTNPDPNHDDYHPGMVAAMTPVTEVYTRKTIRRPTPTITDSEEEPEVTWFDLLDAELIDSTGHSFAFDPVASEESRRFRAQIHPGTTRTSRHLQVAESLQDGVALFPLPGTGQGEGLGEGLEYGSVVAGILARSIPAPHRTGEGTLDGTPVGTVREIPRQTPQQTSRGAQQGGTGDPGLSQPPAVSRADSNPTPGMSSGPGSTFTTTAGELEAGQYVTFEEIGAEIMIREIHVDADGSCLVVGYDDEGQEIALDVPADSPVDVRIGDDDTEEWDQ
jgi:S-DNA-T family DNA segregation ATPase FtsK/SpoIIIE